MNGAYVFCDHLIVSLSSLSLWGRYTLIALILVPTVRDVNPYIGQSSANIRSIFFDSGTLENVETNKAQSASNTAHLVTSFGLIGLHWTLCPDTDTEKASVIDGSGCSHRRDWARLNKFMSGGDRMTGL